MKIVVLSILLILITNELLSQVTIIHDSIPGVIELGKNVLPILKQYGNPDKRDTLNEELGFKSYYYKSGLIIWAGDKTNKIYSFDVTSSKYSVNTGIRVGDSIEKMKTLYGDKGYCDKELNRSYSIYDYAFKDFTELYLYDFKFGKFGSYIVFYLKESTIVKIYVYEGLGD